MTRPIDQATLDQLSAYLDGALTAADAKAVERLLASDPAIAAEFAALSQNETLLRPAFEDMLSGPVPLSLARTIGRAPAQADPTSAVLPQAANLSGAPAWRRLAYAMALILVGGIGGAYLTRDVAPNRSAAAMGWLDQVAEYHLVYAAQKRHLVEVPATETAHLEKWLSDTTGVAFTVPDLSASDLTFQGARLLVADGRPVAQLLYTTAAGQVVAVCFLAGGEASAGTGQTPLNARSVGELNMVWWASNEAAYVVVGPATGVDLQSIAKTAAVSL